jgi:hypothetical protein
MMGGKVEVRHGPTETKISLHFGQERLPILLLPTLILRKAVFAFELYHYRMLSCSQNGARALINETPFRYISPAVNLCLAEQVGVPRDNYLSSMTVVELELQEEFSAPFAEVRTLPDLMGYIPA